MRTIESGNSGATPVIRSACNYHMRVRNDLRRLTKVRVSIVNPKRKGKKHKAKGQTRKQKAASIRNLKKARAARKHKAATPHKRKSKKKARKSKGHKKAKKHKKKGRKHKAKKSKGKPWAKGLRMARKALKAKGRKGKRKSRKSKRHGKTVRPTMYKGRTKKGKKVLRHSPRSRYARRGYRFNPADAVKGAMPGSVRKYLPDLKGAKLDVPHTIGGVIGFVTSGYGAGMMRVVIQNYTPNEYAGHAASLVGNIVGTELPAMTVNFVMKKTKMFSKSADAVARGIRYGGYIGLGLNAVLIALKVTKIANIPYRLPSPMSTTKELILTGLGDIDLVAAGMSGILGGIAQDFVSSDDYAGLGDEGLLDAEISALSAYVGRDLDDFSGVPTNDSGMMP